MEEKTPRKGRPDLRKPDDQKSRLLQFRLSPSLDEDEARALAILDSLLDQGHKLRHIMVCGLLALEDMELPEVGQVNNFSDLQDIVAELRELLANVKSGKMQPVQTEELKPKGKISRGLLDYISSSAQRADTE